MGALCASLVATHTLDHLKPWQDQFIISGLVCLGVVIIAFFFLRELSPQLRDQLMVTERERALVEAQAMGIDVEKATAHPIRSMMKLDLMSSSIAISVFLLFYYASVSVLTIYWVVIFNRTDAAGQRHQRLAGRVALRRPRAWPASCPTWPGCASRSCSSGRCCAMVMMLFLIHPDGPPAHELLRQRPRDRPAGGLDLARLRALDGELHRAGRVPQSGADRVGARHLGLDPAHHGCAVVPRAAVRHHDVDRAGRQPERRRHPAGDSGRAALRTEHVRAEVQHDTGAGNRHRRPADDPDGAARAQHPRHHPAGLQQHAQPAARR